MANRKISDLTALTAPATGDLLPIVDISEAAAADKNKKITYGELLASAPAGSAAAPSFSFDGDPNTGIYLPGADQLAISTSGQGRLYIAADGKVGIGVASPQGLLHLGGTGPALTVTKNVSGTDNILFYDNSTANNDLYIGRDSSNLIFRQANNERMRLDSSGRLGIGTSSPSTFNAQLAVIGGSVHADRNIGGAAAQVQFSMGASSGANFGQIGNTGTRWSLGYGSTANTIGTEVLTWDSSNRVGIGNTSPGVNLDVASATPTVRVNATGGGTPSLSLFSAGVYDWSLQGGTALKFRQDATERARIDTSGRLLVGTSTARSNFYNTTATAQIQVEGVGAESASFAAINVAGNAGGARLYMAKGRGGTIGSNTIVSSGDVFGQITFQGNDGSEFVEGATIEAQVDGTPGANDMPGRLVFSTTADGAASSTERVRIDSTGNVGIGTSAPGTKLDVVGTIRAAAAATQDGVMLQGRAGGTSSYEAILTPATLTADRTLTLPNTTGTLITTGDTGTVTSTMLALGGPQVVSLTSTQQSTSVTLADVTALVASLAANATYEVDCYVTFQSAATTTGLNLGFTSPTGCIPMVEVVVPIVSTAGATPLRLTFPNAASTISGNVVGTGVTAINSNHTAQISGIIKNGSTAGNFQVQFATEVAASAVTLQIGSTMVLTRLT